VRPNAPQEVATGASAEDAVLLLSTGADEAEGGRPVATAVTAALLGAGYRVVDPAYLETAGSRAVLQQALGGEANAAAALGLRVMAGFVVLVHCDAAWESEYQTRAGAIQTYVATGSARIFRSGNPEVVGVVELEPSRGRHTDAAAAARLAASAFGEEAGRWALEIIDGIAQRFERDISVRVEGLRSETEVEKMRNVLGAMRWVTEIKTQQMSASGGVAVFTMRIGGSTSSFAARLARLGFVTLEAFDDYTVRATAIPEKMGPPLEPGKVQLRVSESGPELPPERARTRFTCALVMPNEAVEAGMWPEAGVERCVRAALEQVAAALEAPLETVPGVVARAVMEHPDRYLREAPEVLQESSVGARYLVRCVVEVDEGKLRTRLYRVARRAVLPVLMVAVPEEVLGRPAYEPAAQAEIIRALREQGFTVLDPPTSEEVQESEEWRRVLEGNFDAATGVMMRGGAEMLVRGEASAEEFRNVVAPQMPSARAAVAVKVIRLGDASVAYALGEQESAVDATPLVAAKKALEECGAKVAGQLIPWLSGRPNTPTSYELVVFGLTDAAQGDQVVSDLRSRIGVEGVTLLDYVKAAGQATIRLSTFLSLEGLRKGLSQGVVPLEIQTIRAGRLEVKVSS